MIHYALHDAEGSVLYLCSVPDIWKDIQSVPLNGGAVLLDSPPAVVTDFIKSNYVVAGQLVPKVSMGLGVSATSFPADGTSDVTITGIPAGATVTISGAVSAGPETITDGQLVITSNVAGAIIVTIACRPKYLDWSVTLNAT
jgi:hypothetical protein